MSELSNYTGIACDLYLHKSSGDFLNCSTFEYITN